MTSTAKDDVESFNDYVREQTARLSARGESSTDIMDNLFIGYLACSDQRFVSYVERIQQDWQDDPASTLTYEMLMTKMESHYQTRILAGNWKAVTKEQEQIIALQAKINHFQQYQPKKTKKGPEKQAHSNPLPNAGAPRVKVFTGKQAWCSTPPKEGESYTKEVGGKTWHYCIYHKYWANHTSADCSFNPKNKGKRPNATKEPEIDLTAALAAVDVEEVDSDDEE